MKKKCRICNGTKFKKVIDFGKTPLVNSLIEEKDLDKKEKVFPLVVEQCQECSLVQIVNPIDSYKIYRDQDYLYFSGDMPNLSEYFREYAEDIAKRFLQPNDFIVEIGSNDGTMLKHFSGYQVLGIDPATNVVVRALAHGISTLSDCFTERLAKNIVKYFRYAKVIYGNNCIAHIDDLHGIMKGVKTLLTDDGVFIVECNYWGGMVKNKNYSLIYHDHFSYFSLENWIDIAEMYKMKVFDAWVTPAQGGSLRVFLSNNEREITKRYDELQAEEINTSLGSFFTCIKYNTEVMAEAKKLGDLVRDLKARGNIIAGYGAAAKGFSILHLAGITKEISYFVDDSPAKQGKYTPINHIPIISRKEAEERFEKPDYFFITAPNYQSVIMEKEKEFKEKGGRFILSDSSII